jgi:hypothetical protein
MNCPIEQRKIHTKTTVHCSPGTSMIFPIEQRKADATPL